MVTEKFALETKLSVIFHNLTLQQVLKRILTEGGARRGFELLLDLVLLSEVLPEVVRLRGVAQPPEFHPEGDVWTHIMLMLENLRPRQIRLCLHAKRRERYKVPHQLSPGALCCTTLANPPPISRPIPQFRQQLKPNRIHFYGHVEAGVRIAETILARLRFSGDDTAQILALVANHMRFGDVLQMKQSTLKRFLRLPRFDEHLTLHRLDALSAHGDLACYNFARAQYEAEPAPDRRPAPLLTGRDLIAAGYRPSPQFKPMLVLAEDAQLEGAITTREQALALIQASYPLPSLNLNSRK